MPTGYTAGIIDGTTKTFKQFATQCARAMGASIHMRDEPFDAPFKPREPGEYHTKAIEAALLEMKRVQALSDKELLDEERAHITEEIQRNRKAIKDTNKVRSALDKMRNEVLKWEPPTSDHIGVKDFMLKQIDETIKFDGSTDYYESAISDLQSRERTLTVHGVRTARMTKARVDVDYHKKEHSEELKRCHDANEWARLYFASL